MTEDFRLQKEQIMKNKTALAALALLSIFHHQGSTVFAQGSLTPPGAPSATMKSLAQIEPRVAISSSPITLTVPGSYYLTTNLAAAPFGYAIIINADNVTLDLHGYGIYGTNATYGGILVNSNRVTIFNGFVRGCASGYGIYANFSEGSSFEGLNMYTNAGGILLGPRSMIRNSVASQNTGAGIVCTDNDFVWNNVADRNGNGGIYLNGSGNRIDSNQVVSNAYFQVVAANVAAKYNLIIRNSLAGTAPLINGTANWLNGPLVDSSSIATNNNPNANFNMNQ
jgi:parallel beta-helix repeat protein